ncbi:rhamnogalacturonan acetylesterase RhgT [Bacteroidia bacterium]|nr:rhamnogalacturonan acetylesterase RhgT [Bacteroidia bacterium]
MYKHRIILLAIGICFLATALKKPENKITIYTIGDSTMANKDTTNGNPERGWAMAFQPFFEAGKVVVENHAMNGRSTKSFIDEGRWKVVADKLKKGDYVFIQFGHNDEKREDPSRYADAQGAYKTNLKRYVEETRAKKANPVLMTPIIRRTFDNNGVLTNTHDDYPDAVRALAEELNVPLIDMEKKTRHLIQPMGPEDSKSLFMWFPAGHSAAHPNGITDNTHLNERGACLVAKEAAEGIREQNLPLAGYLAACEHERHENCRTR